MKELNRLSAEQMFKGALHLKTNYEKYRTLNAVTTATLLTERLGFHVTASNVRVMRRSTGLKFSGNIGRKGARTNNALAIRALARSIHKLYDKLGITPDKFLLAMLNDTTGGE